MASQLRKALPGGTSSLSISLGTNGRGPEEIDGLLVPSDKAYTLTPCDVL